METTGTCPRCGGNMNPAQEGGLNFLKCEYCGYKAQVGAPAQEVIDIQGIPGMPSLHITRQASGVEAQWMNMVSQMSQQGFALPQHDLNLTPERKQAIVEQVRASMGDAMADQAARSMGVAAGGGMASTQPVIAAPAATMQQIPGAQTWQGWGQSPAVQTNRLLRPLLIGAAISVGACLMLGVIAIMAASAGRGGSLNLAALSAPLNRLLAGFGMPPMTGFSLKFGGGFLLGGVASLIAAGLGGLRAMTARNWPTAEGVILSSVVYGHGSGSNRSYEADIRYQYQVGERTYSGNRLAFGSRYYRTDQGAAHRTTARFPQGSAVRVHYDPSRPENAVLEVRFQPAGLFMLLGVIFSAIGAGGMFFGGFVP